MQQFTEAEIQALIAAVELEQPVTTPNNIGYSFYPKTIEQAAAYFRRSRVDWTDAIAHLKSMHFIMGDKQPYKLTGQGLIHARQLRQERPPLWYWYQDFFAAVPTSQAHADYCEQLFGKNLCQLGFMEMPDLEHLLKLLNLKSSDTVLDLGCGNGMIAEYISDTTGAVVYGMDYIPEAIRQAQMRTITKRERMIFEIGNLDYINFPANQFDAVISVDTLYMPANLNETVSQIKALLKPGGHVAIFYSHMLWEPSEQEQSTLSADKTPVATALQANNLPFKAYDYTQAAGEHARRTKLIADIMRPRFEAEGNGFMNEIHFGEADGTLHTIAAGTYARYLYDAVKVIE